ncbi:hypothetical protein ILUMI_04034 [Ignelater luminosus]|uniref:Craniofacial development protein 2-like n=1 Tax=Ignelater luminosus TaxID=2038154 RepID=A0A8K0GJE1_IGNLU|nr:hypothetical protein ILUMI_04034 [Ignelater luminosus]
MSFRASGAADAASGLKDITTTFPSKAAKYKTAFKAADSSPCKEISGDLALSNVVKKVTRIGMYAPLNTTTIQEKEDFMEELTNVLNTAHDRKKIIMMGNFNGRIGQRRITHIVGSFGEEEATDTQRRMLIRSLYDTGKDIF